MQERIQRLNRYVIGWLGYYALADFKTALGKLHRWVLKRLMACLWVQWPQIRTRRRRLLSLGVPQPRAHALACSRRGPWRMTGLLRRRVFTDAYWQSVGTVDFVDRYTQIRQDWRTA